MNRFMFWAANRARLTITFLPMYNRAEYMKLDITYGGYLGLDKILGAQILQSENKEHDEMLFIVMHQVYELWFKLLLHESDALQQQLTDGQRAGALRGFSRLIEMVKVFDTQLGILETMSPTEFSKFRDHLMPASGFQSWQFREVEFVFGARDERYLRVFDSNPAAKKKLEARLNQPTVWDSFVDLLVKSGFTVDSEEGQQNTIVEIYRDDRHLELRILCEAMIEFDERFGLWRQHHVRMAERMIGNKVGTGQKHVQKTFGDTSPMGAMGVAYLRSTLDRKFFPVLWDARNEM